MCMTRRGAKEEGMRGKKGGGKQRTFFAKGWKNDAVIISPVLASRVLGKMPSSSSTPPSAQLTPVGLFSPIGRLAARAHSLS